MRSDSEFPNKDEDLTGVLSKIWKEGWFDEYSDDHFLIKVFNKKLDNIHWARQLVENNSHGIYSPINADNTIDYSLFVSNFVYNFSFRMNTLISSFGELEIEKFVKDQLSAGKATYDEDQFFQALSEIEILIFYCRKADWSRIVYEPPIGMNSSNPEASFELNTDGNTYKINIEVKTPKFLNPVPNHEAIFLPCVLLNNEGRKIISELCKEYKIKYIAPRVTKLVDFINSAAKKFKKPAKNEFNLLYINWSYSDFPSNGFYEAWKLLSNSYNGIMTNKEVDLNLPFKEAISPDAYEKITAIIVYTSSIDQLMFSDFSYAWQGTDSRTGQRFRVLLLDKSIDKSTFFAFTSMNPCSSENYTFFALLASSSTTINVDEFKKKSNELLLNNLLDPKDLKN